MVFRFAIGPALLFRACLTAVVCITAQLDAAEEPLVIELWPEGVPGLRADASEEKLVGGRITNIHRPTLTVFVPDKQPRSETAVIYCPGGGYVRWGVAPDGGAERRMLNELGITVFMLKYRMAEYGHPAPLRDVLRAVRLVRSRANEFGLRPDRIGVLGGSAGGHLAGCAATLWESPLGKTNHELDAVSARPDFAVLIYPIVTMDEPVAHKGSRKALLGERATPDEIQLLSLEKNVRKDTPPLLIIGTMADQTVPVENSLRLYQAARDAGVPAEMHVYAHGSHGNSLDPKYGPTAMWPKRMEEWMRFNGWLP